MQGAGEHAKLNRERKNCEQSGPRPERFSPDCQGEHRHDRHNGEHNAYHGRILSICQARKLLGKNFGKREVE
jgi:hypothetical protein